MKIKKILLILMIFIFGSLLSSCDLLPIINPTTTTSSISLTTYPEPVNGTITFLDMDYNDFPVYVSPTYSLKNIKEYNNVLFQTKDLIRHSNIAVQTTLTEEKYPFPWSDTKEEFLVGSSSGSGFVFQEKDGYYYALTNYHVINPMDYTASYTIATYSDVDTQEATVVAANKDLDLAVVKFLVNDRTDVTILNIYNRLYYKFNIGELVMAVGNPSGLLNNVTFGEFNSMQDIDNASFKVIYHSASIHEGSSGGALVDVDGNLLGMNTWGLDSADDYSFAIPNYIIYTFLINYGIIE